MCRENVISMKWEYSLSDGLDLFESYRQTVPAVMKT